MEKNPQCSFWNLEKQNKVNKEIRKLSTENEDIISEQKAIIKEVFNFYSKLYAKKEVKEINLDILLDYSDILKFSFKMSSLLEGPLCIDEVYTMLKHMKNNKSPGQDGFTVEFYRFFWEDIK